MGTEAVDVFFWGNEAGKCVGFCFILNGELEDDAVNSRVGVGLLDFFSDFGGVFSIEIFDGDADIFTVFDFEINVFRDDGIIAVADDEEFRFRG